MVDGILEKNSIVILLLIFSCCYMSYAGKEECASLNCVNGKAEYIHSECICICDDGFMGPVCDSPDLCAQENPCQHGGRCYTHIDGQLYCDCPLGYIGSDCGDRDPCASKAGHCLNGATCQRLDDVDFACACALPYDGDHCERMNLCNLDVGECLDVKNPLGQIIAECYPCTGFTAPGGCYVDHTGDYSCSCTPGYGGKICDKLMNASKIETSLTLPIQPLSRMTPHNFIVHNFQHPGTRNVVVAIEMSSAFILHVSMREDFRPLCPHVLQYWDDILPTNSGAVYRHLYPLQPARSTRQNRYDAGGDYYVIFWPESLDTGPDRRMEVTLGLAFYQMDCIFTNDAGMNDTSEECFTTDAGGHPRLRCDCKDSPWESISPFLKPLEFRAEIYVPVNVITDLRPCYIIPWIVLAFLILYILLLVLLAWCDKRSARAIRYVVLTEIELIYQRHFYLLTVETGQLPYAGTSANVSCEIYGSLARSSALNLGDKILKVLNRRGDVVNYIFSTPEDLGEVQIIRIWHDNAGDNPSWFLAKLMVKNIKTNRCWHFQINRWLSAANYSLIWYAYVETTIGKDGVREPCRSVLCRRLRDEHLFISPFFHVPFSDYNSCEHVTVLFTAIFLHMFILICFYGFPDNVDPIYLVEWGDAWFFAAKVVLYGLAASIIAVLISFAISFWRRSMAIERIPTLLVCNPAKKVQTPPPRPPSPPNVDIARWENLDPDRPMVVAESMKVEPQEVNKSDSAMDFRIPSTSVSKTENWIASNVTRRRRTSEDHVKRIASAPKLQPYKKVLNDGIVGAVTHMKDEDSQRLIYKPEPDDSIDDLIAKDIRHSFNRTLWPLEDDFISSKSDDFKLPNLTLEANVKVKEADAQADLDLKLPPLKELKTEIEAFPSFDVVEDKNIFVSLCQVLTLKKTQCCSRKICRILFWMVCIILIAASAIVTIMYGMRYGITTTFNWIYSFIWTFIFSFVLSFILVLIVSLLCHSKHQGLNYFETKCRICFQLLWLDDCSETQTCELKHLVYYPKCFYRPLTASTMFVSHVVYK